MKSAMAGPRCSVPERHRRVDAQHAARLGLQPRHRTIGFFQVGEDGDAALVIRLARSRSGWCCAWCGRAIAPRGLVRDRSRICLRPSVDRRNSRAAAAKPPSCTTLVKALMLVSFVHSASRRGSAIVLKSST